MNILEAIVLGVVQGLTEFLPVSSSGHLVIAQELLGFDKPGILFEVIVHLATTLSILIYFREKIFTLSKKYILLIIIGSVPAGIIGLLFRSLIEDLFLSLFVVGIGLIVTGVFNFFTDRAQARRERITKLDSLFVGVAQASAIIPGISRSGATIFAGTAVGVDRKAAAEFSFILSIPVVLGANFLELFTVDVFATSGVLEYLLGFAAAFVSGMIAIPLVMRILFDRFFKYFGVYVVALAAAIILFLV